MELTTAMILLILLCFLSVKAGPPVFNDDISNITAKQNVILKVRCSADGEPKPTYEWYNEHTQKVGPHMNPPIWVENGSDNDTQLVFNTTSEGHTGEYTCIAQNSHGLRSKVFEVNIIDGEDDIEVSNVSATSVTFSFPSDSDGLYDLNLEYIEKYQNVTYTHVFARFTGKILKVGDLIPSGQYNFSFSRKPDEQWNLTVVLLPAKPEVIIHSLNDGLLTFAYKTQFADYMRNTIDYYQLTYVLVRMTGVESVWTYDESCNVSIQIPRCASNKHTLANFRRDQYYEIRLRAHTSAGYGEFFKTKIFIPK